MIEINGRFFAWALAGLAVAALAVLAVVGGASNGLTDREWVAGSIAFVALVIAALWLWRHPSQGGQR